MSQEKTIQIITSALNETEERPRSQIAAIVRALGEEQALAVLVEANEVERTGGMMLPDGSRRRTPGGVFFAIARRRLSPAERDAIFPKTPTPGKEGDKSGDTTQSRPDRRHVRLIRPSEPRDTRPEPMRGLRAAATAPERTAESTVTKDHPANGSTQEKAEVKLVRLDRRRIVPLRNDPLAAPAAAAVAPVPSKSQTADAASRTGTSRQAAEQTSQPPPGLALALERSQIKKHILGLLEGLAIEQRRLVLLDLLADVDGSPATYSGSGRADPELRGRILAAVGNRLGIPVGRIALTIYGADTPVNRKRVKALSGDAED